MLSCNRHMCVYSAIVTVLFLFFFFKQKTAYEMRISDWSSDVCSSDLFPIAQTNQKVFKQIHPEAQSQIQGGKHGKPSYLDLRIGYLDPRSGRLHRLYSILRNSARPHPARARKSRARASPGDGRDGLSASRTIGRAWGRARVGQYV